ncbi:MAG: hypothetical protein JNK60_16210, partial [Acidobacteria bacterium]|nr:hypothetical protein [Acidobacteriota bacterium]
VLVVAVPVYLICAFAIAGSRQLEAGRMDALASHHTLVRWLLGLLGIPVALLGVWAIAIALVGPSSLHRLAISAREGSWIGLHGAATGRGNAGFLYDTASGRSLRLPPFTSPTIAPNGSSAAWPVSRSAGRYELSAWDLTGAPRELPLPGVVFPIWPALAISPNGTRIATMDGSSLVVLELASARVLGSTSFPRSVPAKSLRFLTEDRVLFLEGSVSSGTTKVHEYDVAARALTSLFEIPATNWSKGPDFSRDGTLCLTSDAPGKLVLRSGRTGGVTATLVDDARSRAWGALLPDGRIVAIVKKIDAPRTVSLHVFSREGLPERTLPLDGVFASFVGRTGAGRLVLSIIHRKGPVPEGAPTLSYSLVSVDVDASAASGDVKTLAQNVRVLRRDETLDLEPTPLVGIEGFEASDRLVRVDETTGAVTPVLEP